MYLSAREQSLSSYEKGKYDFITLKVNGDRFNNCKNIPVVRFIYSMESYCPLAILSEDPCSSILKGKAGEPFYHLLQVCFCVPLTLHFLT
jgi:hypothetical protein